MSRLHHHKNQRFPGQQYQDQLPYWQRNKYEFYTKLRASEKSDAPICLQFSAADNRLVHDIIVSKFPFIQKLIPDR